MLFLSMYVLGIDIHVPLECPDHLLAHGVRVCVIGVMCYVLCVMCMCMCMCYVLCVMCYVYVYV